MDYLLLAVKQIAYKVNKVKFIMTSPQDKVRKQNKAQLDFIVPNLIVMISGVWQYFDFFITECTTKELNVDGGDFHYSFFLLYLPVNELDSPKLL